MSAVRAPSRFRRLDAASLSPPPVIRRGRQGQPHDRVVLRGDDGRLLVSEPGRSGRASQAAKAVPEAWFTEENGLILPADFFAGDSGKG